MPNTNMPKDAENICHLCGDAIDSSITDGDLAASDEHIPPKQFYPKKMRGKIRGQLLKLPSHKGCNGSFKHDEEYFVHTYAPHVNPQSTSGRQLIEDIQRRAQNSGNQSRRLLSMIKREFSDVTQGGISLPHGIVVHNVNAPRVDRVVRKILQGLHYHEEERFLPHETSMWIQLYESLSDMPEHWRKIFCETGPCRGVYPEIFAYRFRTLNDHVFLSMVIWDSLLFCIIIKKPKI